MRIYTYFMLWDPPGQLFNKTTSGTMNLKAHGVDKSQVRGIFMQYVEPNYKTRYVLCNINNTQVKYK